VFACPAVTAPRIHIHASHPTPSWLQEQRHREFVLKKELSSRAVCLHNISARMTVQFPELRLIEYDCGRLIVFKMYFLYMLFGMCTYTLLVIIHTKIVTGERKAWKELVILKIYYGGSFSRKNYNFNIYIMPHMNEIWPKTKMATSRLFLANF
jgi:hypothetical protein